MNSHKKASLIMLLLLLHFIFGNNILMFILIKIFPSIVKTPITYQMIGSIIIFIIPVIIYMLIEKVNLNKFLMLKPISLKNVVAIVILSITMQPLLQVINALTTIFSENTLSPVIASFLDAPFWQLILTVAVLPAFLEEIIFRGIFNKEYEKCPFWFGVIFSGIFFGMMHLTITQLFYAIIAGAIMSILVKVTGSIWSSILCHFILNGTQITLAYISSNIFEKVYNKNYEELVNNSMQLLETSGTLAKVQLIFVSLIDFALSLPFLIGAIYLFVKINKENINIIKKENLLKAENSPPIFNIFFIGCIIVYLGYFVILKMF